MIQRVRPSAGSVPDEQARRLLTMVSADPHASLKCVITGSGGSGKSTLLRELARIYREAGAEVVTEWPLPAKADRRRVVLLLDDAHFLADEQARRLCESGLPRLVVACRPWPRSVGFAALLQALSRAGHAIALEPLDVVGVRRMLHGLGLTVTADVPKCMHDLTGGVPGWVARMAAVWPASGTPGGVPEGAVASFRFDLELLDRDVLRYLVAAQSGMGQRIDLIGRLLGRTGDALAEVIGAARATGLLGPDATPYPLCAKAFDMAIPAELRLGVRQRLAELQLDSADEPVLPLAKALLDSGGTGTTVAALLHSAAREAVSEDPVLAVELFEGAVTAGRPAAGVLAEWAEAAALAADLDTALRLADQAISSNDSGIRSRGARVAAAALAHRGQWARSAELYAWSGDKPFAEIASIAVGGSVPSLDLNNRPPTLLDGAATLMADGIRASVNGNPADALAALVRASALLEPSARDALLPDSPAALAVLVALQCGETDTAESVLDAAETARMGGCVMTVRHMLLRAWIQLTRGQLVQASQLLAQVHAVEPRDRLFAVALEVALARRTGDLATLRGIWAQACDCLVRHPVDLFTLLPLGEFAVAAARLRDARVRAPLREAHALIERLGNPPLWATHLHWSALQAAIVAESRDEARRHIHALAEVRTPYSAALAQAGACWVEVASGDVDLPRVLAASRSLLDAGLYWDSARLASEAAIRTADRKEMTTLLECARQVQAHQQRVQTQHHTPLTKARPTDTMPQNPLSDREQEVADLVLQGMTYKQVGERLFISAKTVEHHMARMRNRLGATTRRELLTQLKSLMTAQG